MGETRQTLRKLMIQIRSDNKSINSGNQPGHAPSLSMKVRITENIYHYINSSILNASLRRDRENSRIRELDTAMQYGCNYNIKGVGSLSSPTCSDVNVMSLFNFAFKT